MGSWCAALGTCAMSDSPGFPSCLPNGQAREGLKVITIICANRVSLAAGCFLLVINGRLLRPFRQRVTSCPAAGRAGARPLKLWLDRKG